MCNVLFCWKCFLSFYFNSLLFYRASFCMIGILAQANDKSFVLARSCYHIRCMVLMGKTMIICSVIDIPFFACLKVHASKMKHTIHNDATSHQRTFLKNIWLVRINLISCISQLRILWNLIACSFQLTNCTLL